MLEYMQFFAELSREANVESYAIHLEENIKRFKKSLFKPSSLKNYRLTEETD